MVAFHEYAPEEREMTTKNSVIKDCDRVIVPGGVHCNPRYLEGRGRRIVSSRLAWTKGVRPYLQNKNRNKRAGGYSRSGRALA